MNAEQTPARFTLRSHNSNRESSKRRSKMSTSVGLRAPHSLGPHSLPRSAKQSRLGQANGNIITAPLPRVSAGKECQDYAQTHTVGTGGHVSTQPPPLLKYRKIPIPNRGFYFFRFIVRIFFYLMIPRFFRLIFGNFMAGAKRFLQCPPPTRSSR